MTGTATRSAAAVEVLSASTWLIDLNLKKDRYRRAGIASYWVVDPGQALIRAFELRDGDYAEVATVTGEEHWAAVMPFDVTISPGNLFD